MARPVLWDIHHFSPYHAKPQDWVGAMVIGAVKEIRRFRHRLPSCFCSWKDSCGSVKLGIVEPSLLIYHSTPKKTEKDTQFLLCGNLCVELTDCQPARDYLNVSTKNCWISFREIWSFKASIWTSLNFHLSIWYAKRETLGRHPPKSQTFSIVYRPCLLAAASGMDWLLFFGLLVQNVYVRPLYIGKLSSSVRFCVLIQSWKVLLRRSRWTQLPKTDCIVGYASFSIAFRSVHGLYPILLFFFPPFARSFFHSWRKSKELN